MASQPHQHSFLALDPHGFHRVAYSEWGNPSQHRLVICVHGLTRNCRDFDSLAAALAGHFRVVCMDVVGRGASDWLEHKGDYWQVGGSGALENATRVDAELPIHVG